MTMATQTLRATLPSPRARTQQKPVSKPLWQRLFDFIAAAQARRAEREIARYLRTKGMTYADFAVRDSTRQRITPAVKS
jgi:hypothetical protein